MSEYTTEYVDRFYENTPEMNNIITIEIQNLIQEYANENKLIDLKCYHVFELPRIVRYYGAMFDNGPDNYRKSYCITDFYSYDYKRQEVYKGKDRKGKVILKINPPEIKIKKNNYTFINFLER